MSTNAIQSSHIYSTYFAPRGRSRIYTLGMQIAQLYLSPFDQIIGFIGEAGSGKSVLIKGMFPGIELTNDDDGVNVRPLPLLEQEYETGFFTPHTYHLDIRFETGFHQLSELADAVRLAVRRGKRIIIEHFDLIYPLLGVNANLLIGVGEQIVITRPNLFGPLPQELCDIVYPSLAYRLMAHSAEDLCEYAMTQEQMLACSHGDIRHGFVLEFNEHQPDIDIPTLEARVNELIRQDLPIDYYDESHILLGGAQHYALGRAPMCAQQAASSASGCSIISSTTTSTRRICWSAVSETILRKTSGSSKQSTGEVLGYAAHLHTWL